MTTTRTIPFLAQAIMVATALLLSVPAVSGAQDEPPAPAPEAGTADAAPAEKADEAATETADAAPADSADETSVVNFELRPALQEGMVMSFDNIYFDVASANLKPESYPVLDGVIAVLQDNPDAVIQIAGHTDSDGSDSYNQTLSEQRAASVYSYLVSNGIAARRLSTVGFGESMPVVPNTSAANKARNRRIEFTVLSN